MIAPTVPAKATGKHAKNGRARVPSFGGSSADPILDDLLANATALSLDLSSGQLKHLAKAGAVSPSRASRWRSEGKGNPLWDVTGIVYRLTAMGQHPGAVVAHVLTTMRQALMPISDAELVRRFWTLMEEEDDAECEENKASARLANGGTLEDLERASLEEAALQQELSAVIRELRRRKIDPRTWGQD